jgi:hypothetical protein
LDVNHFSAGVNGVVNTHFLAFELGQFVLVVEVFERAGREKFASQQG